MGYLVSLTCVGPAGGGGGSELPKLYLVFFKITPLPVRAAHKLPRGQRVRGRIATRSPSHPRPRPQRNAPTTHTADNAQRTRHCVDPPRPAPRPASLRRRPEVRRPPQQRAPVFVRGQAACGATRKPNPTRQTRRRAPGDCRDHEAKGRLQRRQPLAAPAPPRLRGKEHARWSSVAFLPLAFFFHTACVVCCARAVLAAPSAQHHALALRSETALPARLTSSPGRTGARPDQLPPRPRRGRGRFRRQRRNSRRETGRRRRRRRRGGRNSPRRDPRRRRRNAPRRRPRGRRRRSPRRSPATPPPRRRRRGWRRWRRRTWRPGRRHWCRGRRSLPRRRRRSGARRGLHGTP